MGRPPATLLRLATRPVRLAASILFALLVHGPAVEAHHFVPGAGGGIPISSLAHGQMQVYARHFDEIVRLAALSPAPAPSFSRVLNFARIQKAWCLWGLAPGAVVDEESPFNECSHAYLAAGRSLLEEMRETAPGASDVARLADVVDRELLMDGVSQLCAFSGESFNTADHVVPRWSGVFGHAPTLGALAFAAALLGGSAAALRRWLPGRAQQA